MSLPDFCPKCQASMVGEAIPEKYALHYGGATYYSRWIGRTDIALDRTVSYLCPDCGTEFEAKEFRRE